MVNIQTILELLILKNKTFCCLLQQKEKKGIISTEHMHTFQGKKKYFVYSCKQKERREEGTLDLYKAIHRSVISPHVPAVFDQIFHTPPQLQCP